MTFLLITHKLSNSPQEISHAITSWNSLIQKEVWAMTSSEWELHVTAQLLKTSNIWRDSVLFFWSEIKIAYYKISKERGIATASAVGLDNLSSNLRIIILLLITNLINTSLLSHHLAYIQINVMIGRPEWLHFVITKIFESLC